MDRIVSRSTRVKMDIVLKYLPNGLLLVDSHVLKWTLL